MKKWLPSLFGDDMTGRLERRVVTTPNPDPTELTTKQLSTAVDNLKEITDTRFVAIEKAVDNLNEGLSRVPGEIEKQVAQLRSLYEESVKILRAELRGFININTERLVAIQTQFKERDVRYEQGQEAARLSMAAALKNAKESVDEQNKASEMAIAKSESAVNKQIDQIFIQIASTTKNMDDKIADVKDRLTAIESEGRGKSSATSAQQTSSSNTVALIGLILGSVIGIAGLIVAFVARHS